MKNGRVIFFKERKKGRNMYMRLYRMELYKLWHKKTFAICSIIGVMFMLFYFTAVIVGEETSTVDGRRYAGYEAVKIDRQITEAYIGELTDESVQRIVAGYGFPSVVEYDYGGWRDANYLNGFVAEYLSDGYIRSWSDYKVPTKVTTIADTDLGELQEALGGYIPFAYTRGWMAFFDLLQMGMMLASILLVIGISIVFAQEGQTKMLPLVFTTQEGRKKDIWAKIAAAFTLTIIVYGVVVLLCVALCGGVYGFDGAACPYCIAMAKSFYIVERVSFMPILSFAGVVLGLNLLAMIVLCAITMCVSAHCKGNFGAVSMAACLWGLPFMIRVSFGGLGYFLTSCMPIFLVQTESVYESLSWGRGTMTVAVGIFVFMVCVEESYRVVRFNKATFRE